MNERIKELAEQANGPNPFYGTLKNQMTLLGDDAVEKFAELIVRDCVKIIESYAETTPEIWGLPLDILEHFDMELNDD